LQSGFLVSQSLQRGNRLKCLPCGCSPQYLRLWSLQKRNASPPGARTRAFYDTIARFLRQVKAATTHSLTPL
jgi:hypothetical protein